MTFTVRVDIPALADLVSYLREKDKTQETINQLTVELAELATRLNSSQSALAGAISTEEQ